MALHHISIMRHPGSPKNEPTSGANTMILLDGLRMRGVHKITLELQAKKPARLVLEMLCEVEVHMGVDADFHDAPPGETAAVDPPRLEDIRPKGSVEVHCQGEGCQWSWWVDALDPSLPDGPFLCDEHAPPEERAARREAAKAEDETHEG
jgi:hypothetical protein